MVRTPGNSEKRDDEDRRERDANLNEGESAATRNARGMWDQQKRTSDERRGYNRDD